MSDFKYKGIDEDMFGGMTGTGKMIRDAWVFGLIPETETCEGWNYKRLEVLEHSVNSEWDKYGCMVSSLPEELRERHQKIYAEAIAKAKEQGWNGEFETKDET